MPKNKITAVVAFAIAAFFALPVDAMQIDMSNPAFAAIGGSTSIPIGHAEFCRENRGECGPNVTTTEAVELDDRTWQKLLTVNAQVNAEVSPVTDQDLYQVAERWTYPAGYGDCEDFVLEKRRELIEAGWPASTLLMAVVRQGNGEGHAVLMVRTDRGDLVLDNQDGLIKVWSETPYQFLKRQSQADQGKWVDILDPRAAIVAATR